MDVLLHVIAQVNANLLQREDRVDQAAAGDLRILFRRATISFHAPCQLVVGFNGDRLNEPGDFLLTITNLPAVCDNRVCPPQHGSKTNLVAGSPGLRRLLTVDATLWICSKSLSSFSMARTSRALLPSRVIRQNGEVVRSPPPHPASCIFRACRKEVWASWKCCRVNVRSPLSPSMKASPRIADILVELLGAKSRS